MQSLALQKTSFLEDEWRRLKPFLVQARTQAARTQVARTMLRIEKELTARKCAGEGLKQQVRNPKMCMSAFTVLKQHFTPFESE